MSTRLPVAEQYLYAKLTWPELREAAALRKVIVLPVGSTEQHGHHLPIDVDNFLATNMGLLAAQRAPDLDIAAGGKPGSYAHLARVALPGRLRPCLRTRNLSVPALRAGARADG